MRAKASVLFITLILLSSSVIAYSSTTGVSTTKARALIEQPTEENNTQNCAGEGESVPAVPDSPECCSGLVKISPAAAGAGGTCIHAVGSMICSNCGNGVCESWENECNCQKDCKSGCVDTDDGRDYYVRGKVRINGAGGVSIDNCVVYSRADDNRSAPPNPLIEFYCTEDGRVGRETFNCPNGCENGACIKEGECLRDSDCEPFFSHCSCGWTCVPKSDEPRVDCMMACPEIGLVKPECGCTNGECAVKTRTCQKVCKYVDTRSEGWYDSCTGKLIKYDDCSREEEDETESCPIGCKCRNGIVNCPTTGIKPIEENKTKVVEATIENILENPEEYLEGFVKVTGLYGGRVFKPLCDDYAGPPVRYTIYDDSAKIGAAGKIGLMDWLPVGSKVTLTAKVKPYRGDVGCAERERKEVDVEVQRKEVDVEVQKPTTPVDSKERRVISEKILEGRVKGSSEKLLEGRVEGNRGVDADNSVPDEGIASTQASVVEAVQASVTTVSRERRHTTETYYLQIIDVTVGSTDSEGNATSMKLSKARAEASVQTEEISTATVKARVLAKEDVLERFQTKNVKIEEAGRIEEVSVDARRHVSQKLEAKGTFYDGSMNPASLIIVDRITSGVGLSDNTLVAQNTKSRGYLRLGENRFVLKDLTVSGDKVTASIVGGGSLTLARTSEQGFNVVKGSFESNSGSGELYLIE